MKRIKRSDFVALVEEGSLSPEEIAGKAEEAGVVWEPEERPLPKAVRLAEEHNGKWLVDGPSGNFWAKLDFEGWALTLEQKKLIAAAVCDAYNRLQAGELVERHPQSASFSFARAEAAEARLAEATAALQRLAKVAKVADDGPDEIVGEVIAMGKRLRQKVEGLEERNGVLLKGCERRAGALHRLAKEAGVSNINGDEAVVDAVLKKIDNAEGMRAKKLRRAKGYIESTWPSSTVNGEDTLNRIHALYLILTEDDEK